MTDASLTNWIIAGVAFVYAAVILLFVHHAGRYLDDD